MLNALNNNLLYKNIIILIDFIYDETKRINILITFFIYYTQITLNKKILKLANTL